MTHFFSVARVVVARAYGDQCCFYFFYYFSSLLFFSPFTRRVVFSAPPSTPPSVKKNYIVNPLSLIRVPTSRAIHLPIDILQYYYYYMYRYTQRFSIYIIILSESMAKGVAWPDRWSIFFNDCLYVHIHTRRLLLSPWFFYFSIEWNHLQWLPNRQLLFKVGYLYIVPIP